MPQNDALTDVEACAIGVVRREQPCTSYAVRKVFEVSPVSRFSSSAGSIYPLMRRLQARGLITGTADATGDRPRTLWRCSPAGETALRAWITTPLAANECLPFDPLRSRMMLLQVLPARQRLAWIKAAETQVAAAIEVTRHLHDETPIKRDVFFDIAYDSCLGTLQMQQRWLAKARDVLDNQ